MIAKTKRDWPLQTIVIGVIIIAVIVLLPFFYFMRSSYRYHHYVKEMTSSFVYGESKNTIGVSLDDEQLRVKKAGAQRLYSVITQTGMGKPAAEAPEAEGMVISFGDGALLDIRPAVITDKGRESDTGVYFCYTNTEGKTFAYDTDRLQYENLRVIVGK